MVEAELELVTHKKAKVQAEKRRQKLNQLLGIQTAKKYRDPGASLKR